MDLTPLLPQGQLIIAGYGNGGFKINNDWIEDSLLLFANRHVKWAIGDAKHMTIESFQPLFESPSAIELLLIGTGKTTVIIAPAIRQALKEQGIALDVMDTGAACRTYNVLVAEERRVAAALLAI